MVNHVPPGPKGRFLMGNLDRFRADPLQFLLSNREQYGDVVRLRFGPRAIYQLNHPDYIQQVLVKHPEQFHKSPILKRVTRQALGQGLLTSDGEFHKRQRRLVQPAFHAKRIAAYGDVMVNYTLRRLAEWRPGEQRDIAHEMMRLTMQIVAKTLFDADVSGEADELGHAITVGIETAAQRIRQPVYLPEWIPTPKNLERRQAAAILEKAILGMINARRASGEDRGDLLSMLLLAVDENDGGQMTDRQVRDEAMTLFIAGHETTANALAWTLYLLAQHSAVEAKLLAENQAVLDGRPPTVQDLPRLSYHDLVIKESMRLYPPAWVITREVIEPLEMGGFMLPKGSICLFSPYVLHRDPRYFDQPACFQPERFASGYEDRIPKYAYFPFGGGPRICIGNQFALMEANLLLATIMQQMHLSLASSQPVQPEPLITLRPHGGIPMRISARTVIPA